MLGGFFRRRNCFFNPSFERVVICTATLASKLSTPLNEHSMLSLLAIFLEVLIKLYWDTGCHCSLRINFSMSPAFLSILSVLSYFRFLLDSSWDEGWQAGQGFGCVNRSGQHLWAEGSDCARVPHPGGCADLSSAPPSQSYPVRYTPVLLFIPPHSQQTVPSSICGCLNYCTAVPS